MSETEKPAIAITMGDPCGIGPEVVVKALADPQVYASCRPVVVGNTYAMKEAVRLTGLPLQIKETDNPVGAGEDSGVVDVLDIHNLNPEDITVGEISVACGKAAMEWVSKAGQLCLAGVMDGMATAPLNKEAAAMAGYESSGIPSCCKSFAERKCTHNAIGQKPAGSALDHPQIGAGGLRLRQERPHR